MNRQTAIELNKLTRSFYDGSAHGFLAGSAAPWPSWVSLIGGLYQQWEQLPQVSVLDVGCGNGRLARCLHENWAGRFTYLGLDASPRLVELAEARMAPIFNAQCRECDLFEDSLQQVLADRQFQLVTLFGVVHHVPSFHRRRLMLVELCKHVAPGGALALSTWQMVSSLGLTHEIVEWRTFNRRAAKQLDLEELEDGDHLIAKPGEPPRYCHFVDESEAARLFDDLPLTLATTFAADGPADDLNCYYVLAQL